MDGSDAPFEVDDAHAGQRLDRFLAERLGGLSRSRIARLIRDGRVRVGERAAKAGLELRAGERVEVSLETAPRPSPLTPDDAPLEVLFQDADLAVIVKPAGLTVHPAPGEDGPTLVHRLLAHLSDLSGVGGVERPGIVHRLDRDTTGVMVIAKHDRSHAELARQFHDREVDKRYLALVLGSMRDDAGSIDRPIGRHRSEPGRMSSRGGRAERAARTDWRRIEDLGVASLLEVRILTGRTHQIRAHLADEGHPVVGDLRYGFERRVRGIGDPGARRLLARVERPLLHAASLAFTHPTSGERMRFETPPPDDLRRAVEALRAHAAPVVEGARP